MTNATAQSMRALLDKQRAAYLRDGPPSAEVRIDRLDQQGIFDVEAGRYSHKLRMVRRVA